MGNNLNNDETNNSKKIIFLIIGVAILTIAVVGISFAYFSYSKIGVKNNRISTGEIAVYLSENSTINISNQFPMKNSEATGTPGISGETGEVSSMNFTITGYSSGKQTIPYKIYAIAGEPKAAPKVRFQNSEISVFMTATPGINTQTITNNIALNPNPIPVNDAVDTQTGWLIASGTIKAGTTSANPQVDSYELKMFVNDTVRISDTNLSVKFAGATTEMLAPSYCASDREVDSETGNYISGCRLYIDASDNNTLKVAPPTASVDAYDYLPTFSNAYYSLKIRVVAQDSTAS